MLGCGSAGMIGQNAHTVAHAKLRYFDIASGPGGDDAMLLIGAQDDDAVIGPAVWIADRAVILIDGLAFGATVRGQRHPASVGDDPVLVALMPDHGRQHA